MKDNGVAFLLFSKCYECKNVTYQNWPIVLIRILK